MRLLIATAHGHLPQTFGGAQSSTHDLAKGLQALGHEVAVLASLVHGRDLLSLYGRAMGRLGKPFARDHGLGYATFRTWRPERAVGAVLQEFRPDAVIVQSMGAVPLALALEAGNTPYVFYFRNAELEGLGGDPRVLKGPFISNSRFTSEFFSHHLRIHSTIIPPMVRQEQYATEKMARDSVVFINPTPKKGLEIAACLAADCPEIPFRFVETWPLASKDRRVLLHRLRELGNVTLEPARRDMKQIYARARVILAPSLWEEAWGRVATEAHINGIPVLATDVGGLPEAVGPGGIVLSPAAPQSSWKEALELMWHDTALYDRLSAQAAAFSRRDEINPKMQLATLLQAVGASVQQHRLDARFPQAHGDTSHGVQQLLRT